MSAFDSDAPIRIHAVDDDTISLTLVGTHVEFVCGENRMALAHAIIDVVLGNRDSATVAGERCAITVYGERRDDIVYAAHIVSLTRFCPDVEVSLEGALSVAGAIMDAVLFPICYP